MEKTLLLLAANVGYFYTTEKKRTIGHLHIVVVNH